MKVLGLTNVYLPIRNAGAQVTLHELTVALAEFENPVQVLTTAMHNTAPYSYEGVEVRTRCTFAEIMEAVSSSDVVIAQLDALAVASRACSRTHTPLVHFVHTNDQKTRNLLRYPVNMVVFASVWLSEKLGRLATAPKHMVVQPLINPAKYATMPGDRVTLVNLSVLKGADVFYALAQELPHRLFLGVAGSHEEQVFAARTNISILANAQSMRERVYARTRLLIMPSRQESFGRVALEAAASGIPTVASPVDGLVDTLGDAALFVPTRQVRDWIEPVEEVLSDSDVYQQLAEKSRARANQMWAQSQRSLSSFLEQLRHI
jgi:glycosyltransferase involved in cell wall biosynthesis